MGVMDLDLYHVIDGDLISELQELYGDDVVDGDQINSMGLMVNLMKSV